MYIYCIFCFQSVSAFAPITNPIQCPWGQKALKGYLGDDVEAHKVGLQFMKGALCHN